MSDGYTKLFADIVDSSIWEEHAEIRVVWVTLLALSNADGLVRGSVGWLAGKSKVSVDRTSEALRKFEAPDPRSRTPDNDGRRIESVGDGWLILNYLHFRDRLSSDPIAIATRERVKRHRERYQALRNAKSVTYRYTPLRNALQSVTGDHSASASASVTASEGVQGEILTEAEAVASVMIVGIPEAFSRYVYADWSTRAGKDAGGVLVSFCPYCTKRWAREQVEWKAKTHKGTKAPTDRNGNAVKPQKSLLEKIIDEI